VDSDGTQDLHHSMRRLPKRISHTCVPAVSVTKPKLGSVDLASPPCSSLRLILQQPYATPDTRRMRYVRHDDQPSDIITPSKHGTEFSSILASVFVFSPLFSYISFDTCFCHLFSDSLLSSIIPSARPGLSFLFGYKHQWEALHVGHFPMVRTRKTGYSLTAMSQALSVGFLFNVVMLGLGCYLFAEHMACQLTTRYESRFNGPTQTGIECQQDMLSGNDKSYTGIWYVAVIAVLVLKEDWVRGESRAWGRDKGTPVVFALTGSGPLHAEQTHPAHLIARPLLL
jgi:hypothetical protein